MWPPWSRQDDFYVLWAAVDPLCTQEVEVNAPRRVAGQQVKHTSCCAYDLLPSGKLTLTLADGGWKTRFLKKWVIFRVYVYLPEGNPQKLMEK